MTYTKADGTEIAGFKYRYDKVGNTVMEEKTHLPGRSIMYGHDAVNRIVDYKVY